MLKLCFKNPIFVSEVRCFPAFSCSKKRMLTVSNSHIPRITIMLWAATLTGENPAKQKGMRMQANSVQWRSSSLQLFIKQFLSVK